MDKKTIKITRTAGGKTQVLVGDEKLRWISNIKIEMEPGHSPKAVITVLDPELDLELDEMTIINPKVE